MAIVNEDSPFRQILEYQHIYTRYAQSDLDDPDNQFDEKPQMLITIEKFLEDVGKLAIKGNFYNAEQDCHDNWMTISRKVKVWRENLAEKRLLK